MKEMTTRYKKSDLERYKEFKKLRKLGNNRSPPPGVLNEWVMKVHCFLFTITPLAFVAIESSMKVYVYSW